MNRINITFFSFLICVFAMQAGVISPETAIVRLASDNSGRMAPREKPVLAETLFATDGDPAIYIFNTSDGFMILSADDTAAPLLGYSNANSYNASNMPPQLEGLIHTYAEQIAFGRREGMQTPKYVRAADANGMNPIAPMLTTKWDQSYPYNLQCPKVSGRNCATGCIATAMAQVMNYWRYPEVGKGTISFKWDDEVGPLSMDFSQQPFDWENMLDEYRRNVGEAQRDAVAYLMKACGYSVRMRYTVSESGAYSENIAGALVNYFGYDKGAAERQRSNYSEEQWNKLIYDNLINVGPVIMNGQSMSGGAHCFVCDGYDKDGLFHINWGWSGMSDGYFLLSALNPSSHGIGGSSGGYNYNQSVVTGILPPLGRLMFVSAEIGNAKSDSGNVTGKGYIYRINEFRNIVLNLSLKGEGGYFSGPVYVTVYETNPETMKNERQMMECELPGKVMLNAGETGSYTLAIDLKDYELSKYYTIAVSYELKGSRTVLTTLRLAASSGVESICGADFDASWEGGCIKVSAAEAGARVFVYDVNGHLVATSTSVPDGGIDLSWLPKGIYITVIENGDGGRKTLRIIQ